MLGLPVVPPQTNIVYVDLAPETLPPLRLHLADRGILATLAPRTRLVTHLDLSRAQIEHTVRAFQDFAPPRR